MAGEPGRVQAGSTHPGPFPNAEGEPQLQALGSPAGLREDDAQGLAIVREGLRVEGHGLGGRLLLRTRALPLQHRRRHLEARVRVEPQLRSALGQQAAQLVGGRAAERTAPWARARGPELDTQVQVQVQNLEGSETGDRGHVHGLRRVQRPPCRTASRHGSLCRLLVGREGRFRKTAAQAPPTTARPRPGGRPHLDHAHCVVTPPEKPACLAQRNFCDLTEPDVPVPGFVPGGWDSEGRLA